MCYYIAQKPVKYVSMHARSGERPSPRAAGRRDDGRRRSIDLRSTFDQRRLFLLDDARLAGARFALFDEDFLDGFFAALRAAALVVFARPSTLGNFSGNL